MIVAIYGIPRSGKDTFINEIISRKPNSFHLKGSSKLNEIAYSKYGCSFRELDIFKQDEIRIEFTKYAKELESCYSLIIVDGHYSFPGENGFKSVFTKEDLELYDAFFYLKRTPKEISRNFHNGGKENYASLLLDENKCEEWINFEICNMKEVVEDACKDFIVLDSDSISLDFVTEFENLSNECAKRIADEVVVLANGRKVVLTDLDKTVSINDLTNDFIIKANLDSRFPKAIFKGDYYTQYQFYKFHNWLMSVPNYDEAVSFSLKHLVINEYVLNDLYNLKKEACVIALTTGMADAWSKKNQGLNVFDKIYGFGKENQLVITPLIKKLVARYVTSRCETIAFGDSIIDLGMLSESKKGYLVSMTKLDKRIIACNETTQIADNIYQPKYSSFKYDFIKEGEIKW